MLTLLKLMQSLVKALNSDGTPGQVAAGIALGSIFGLTPLLSLHNLVMVAVIFLFNISIPGALLGWLLFVPAGFALDPVFDALGRVLLLDAPLAGLWTDVYNAPVLALGQLTNTVVLGSLVGWMLLAAPIYVLAHWGVRRYRATIYQRLKGNKVFRAIQASKLYNVYKLFRP